MLIQIGGDLNEQLKQLTNDKIIKLLKERNDLMIESLKILFNILRKKNIDFSIFQYFGDKDFIVYLATMFETIQLIMPFLDHFPEGNLTLNLIFGEIDNSIHEVMFTYFGVDIYSLYFGYLRLLFMAHVDSLSNQSKSQTLTDDSKIFNMKKNIIDACKFLMREGRINAEGSQEKAQNIINALSELLEKFIFEIYNAFFKFNYGERIRDLLIETVFYLMGIKTNRKDFFERLHNHILTNLIGNVADGDFQVNFQKSFSEQDVRKFNMEGQIEFKKKMVAFLDWTITKYINKDGYNSELLDSPLTQMSSSSISPWK